MKPASFGVLEQQHLRGEFTSRLRPASRKSRKFSELLWYFISHQAVHLAAICLQIEDSEKKAGGHCRPGICPECPEGQLLPQYPSTRLSLFRCSDAALKTLETLERFGGLSWRRASPAVGVGSLMDPNWRLD
jgi:hypothetical protein